MECHRRRWRQSTRPARATPSTPALSTQSSTPPARRNVCDVPAFAEHCRPASLGRSVRSPIVRRCGECMSRPTKRKFALIGGGGVRTPLVVFGINESAEALGADELVLYDPDAGRLRIMA